MSNFEGSFGNLPLRRQAQLTLLRDMADEAKRLTGADQYLYATRDGENGEGKETFHFLGGARKGSFDAALDHMQGILIKHGGTRYR